MKPFDGKVAVVTGGASGIGDAIVRRLLAGGARVVACDVNAELLSQRAEEFGAAFRGVAADVTVEAEVERFVSTCLDDFGRLDIAVNAAGASRSGVVTDLTEADWDFTVDLCMKGVFLSMKHEARAMGEAGGAIVNISSVCARFPVQGGAAYCAAKSGVEMLSKVAALELAPRAIRVNAVLPGYTHTPGMQLAAKRPDQDRAIVERIPLRRAGSPADIAAAALFLCGSDAGYITGTSLVVDGGWELTAAPVRPSPQ